MLRLVVRISLRHIRAQVVLADLPGDRTLASAFSKELPDWGWRAYTGNLPAAYLVGFLCGHRSKEADIEEKCVLDLDRHVPTPQAKIFGAVKGALDAGLSVLHGEEALPSDERVRGEHIARYAEELGADNEFYQDQFANYLENDLAPEKLPEHFEQVKREIIAQYGE